MRSPTLLPAVSCSTRLPWNSAPALIQRFPSLASRTDPQRVPLKIRYAATPPCQGAKRRSRRPGPVGLPCFSRSHKPFVSLSLVALKPAFLPLTYKSFTPQLPLPYAFGFLLGLSATAQPQVWCSYAAAAGACTEIKVLGISIEKIAIFVPFGAATLLMLWMLWNLYKQGKG